MILIATIIKFSLQYCIELHPWFKLEQASQYNPLPEYLTPMANHKTIYCNYLNFNFICMIQN